VGEARVGAREARAKGDHAHAGIAADRGGREFQVRAHIRAYNGFEPPDIEEIKREGTLARRVDTVPAEFLAEPEQPLCLAKLGPWEGPRQQRRGKGADRGAARFGLADDPRRIA
jgi:hypothetical protein